MVELERITIVPPYEKNCVVHLPGRRLQSTLLREICGPKGAIGHDERRHYKSQHSVAPMCLMVAEGSAHEFISGGQCLAPFIEGLCISGYELALFRPPDLRG